MKLTPRESEVYELLRQGLSNKEIARKLAIAESTVKIYVTKILQVYEVTSTKRLLASHESGAGKATAIDLDPAPIGWVKRTRRGIRGLMFTKRSPGEGWEPIYTEEKRTCGD
jgi:DNA-binding CsgD family transcriptional regulator